MARFKQYRWFFLIFVLLSICNKMQNIWVQNLHHNSPSYDFNEIYAILAAVAGTTTVIPMLLSQSLHTFDY